MKKYILFSFLLIAGLTLKASELEFFLDLCRFQDPQNNPYIEVYLTVDGSSIAYERKGDTFQGAVNIKFKLNRTDTPDSVTVFYDNYNFLVNVDDTTEVHLNQGQLDLKRIPLEPGKYSLQVTMIDLGKESALPLANKAEFEITASKETFTTSDIEFLTRMTTSKQETPFTKNGYEVVPYGFNAAFINEEMITFYLELYHTDKMFSSPYFVQATFIKDNQPLFLYDFTEKKSPSGFDVVKGEFDITQLASGMYYIQIKIFNKEHPDEKIITDKIYVYNAKVMPKTQDLLANKADVFNIYTEKEIDYYIKTLIHYSNNAELQFVKALATYEDKKNYIYSFWEKRVTEEKDLTQLWNGHLAALNYVNENFESTYREGFQTDRGRVFLMYGIPSDIERFVAESGSLPHELWKYDQLGTQSRVLFVFLDNDLATNEYPLIHSSKYGELQNYSWQDMLLNGDTRVDPNPSRTRDPYENRSTNGRN